MNNDEVAHAVHRNTEQHVSKLEEIRELLEAGALEIAIGGTANDRKVYNWPVPGKRRWSISDRRASGSDGLIIAANTATDVVPELPGRIGGQIVNSGSGATILYLSGKGRAGPGVAAIWLASGGGAWDFRLGNSVWAGPVSTISASGTTLVIAQV